MKKKTKTCYKIIERFPDGSRFDYDDLYNTLYDAIQILETYKMLDVDDTERKGVEYHVIQVEIEQ